MSEAATRFSLRDLPLPAKLVVTCFLLAVGGGYSAAMLQLHFQDAKSGEPMPTVADVILKYTGKKWFETEPEKPPSRFVKLLITEAGAPFNGSGTMLPAFTTRDGGEFTKATRAGASLRDRLQPERDGERDVLVLWAESQPDVRKKAYEDDHFGLDAGKEPKAITPKFKSSDGAFKVKSIIDTRCVRCHKPGGDDDNAANFSLENYEHLEKYLTAPVNRPFQSGGDWVKISDPISLDKLTQSTHAHLLSFAMLFSLTGLAFAFTSYPAVIRCVLGPWVLVALVADISLWWLARLCDQWGPYFAMGIIGTGGAAGVGLMLQITLGVLNIYGWKGKAAVLAVFALVAAGAGMLYVNQIKPGLERKENERAKVVVGEVKPPEVVPKKGADTGNPPPVAATQFEKMLQFPVRGPDGKELATHKIPFNKDHDGGMARAFFDKDGSDFAAAVKEKDIAAQEKLTPTRHAEREALLAWVKIADSERRKAFDADAFALPPALAGKPITPDYVKGGQLLVKSLVTDRCIRCHADDENAPFDDYEKLSKYLK